MSTPADKQILEPGLQIACRRRDAEGADEEAGEGVGLAARFWVGEPA